MKIPKRPRKMIDTGRETPLVRAIRHKLNSLPGCHLARNTCGVFTNPAGQKVKVGLGDGSADLVGLVRMPSGLGRFVGIEVKGRHGRISDDQIAWASVMRKHGGFAAIVFSVPEALDAIERARKGLSE